MVQVWFSANISVIAGHSTVHSPLHPGWAVEANVAIPWKFIQFWREPVWVAWIYFRRRHPQPSHIAQPASLFGITTCLNRFAQFLNFSTGHVLQWRWLQRPQETQSTACLWHMPAQKEYVSLYTQFLLLSFSTLVRCKSLFASNLPPRISLSHRQWNQDVYKQVF